MAEGIESAGQLESLRELGCEFGQGFYLGPPTTRRPDGSPSAMHGHALAAIILLALSGLLRPLQWRAWGFVSSGTIRYRRRPAPPAPRPNASPDRASMSLNAIELALIAEHSLEMARGNQAVADDATRRPETRREAAAGGGCLATTRRAVPDPGAAS